MHHPFRRQLIRILVAIHRQNKMTTCSEVAPAFSNRMEQTRPDNDDSDDNRTIALRPPF